MKKILVLVASLLIVTQLFSQTKPKYIFLFIGDGMGLVQSQLADSYLRATCKDSLAFVKFPSQGFQTTYSLSSAITCSAAAGTAIACGQKTMANYIGIAANGKDTLESIAVKAKNSGMKVGIITSVSIDHATPAVFYAHDASRNSYHSIAMQLPKSQFDFFGGGAFLKPIHENENAYNELKKYDYALVTSPDSLQYISKLGKKVCVFDNQNEFSYGIDSTKNRFTLANVTKTAIECLTNPKGFFMMVEGGKIDWACHSNDAATAVYETIEFNKAINEALEFYKKYPNETLIIVTADHETGGMGIGSAMYPYYTNIALLSHQKASYVEFEKVLQHEIENSSNVFTFATCMNLLQKYYAVGSPNGIVFNAYDSLRIQRAVDFVINPQSTLTNDETKRMYNTSISTVTYAPKNRCMAIVTTMNTILAEKSGIGWTTFAHTGVKVPVFSVGIASQNFAGSYDNTDIAKKITLLLTK